MNPLKTRYGAADGPEPHSAVTGTGGPPGERTSARLGTYLRRLREGYGYTLRKVEEKATALGEAIDNSQLSRFEKGKALPSFDKLRALARIFNVSVQSFSDVIDLEEFEAWKPDGTDFDALIESGKAHFARGEAGRAFVTFERALEVVESDDPGPTTIERIADARWRMAASLLSMGKLSMTERELREILKLRNKTGPRVQIDALLKLSHVHRELGDRYLAEVLARESLELATREGNLRARGSALNTLGNIAEEDDPQSAIPFYEQAYEIFKQHAEDSVLLMVLTNLGGTLVKAHRHEDGVQKLDQAYARAAAKGYRRIAALAQARLAEAALQRGALQRAQQHLQESDTLAGGPGEPYHDILFLNTFHRWSLARQEGNATRERLQFGRLRHLRSRLERKFAEVDEFDRHVERIRRRDHENAQ